MGLWQPSEASDYKRVARSATDCMPWLAQERRLGVLGPRKGEFSCFSVFCELARLRPASTKAVLARHHEVVA